MHVKSKVFTDFRSQERLAKSKLKQCNVSKLPSAVILCECVCFEMADSFVFTFCQKLLIFVKYTSYIG